MNVHSLIHLKNLAYNLHNPLKKIIFLLKNGPLYLKSVVERRRLGTNHDRA